MTQDKLGQPTLKSCGEPLSPINDIQDLIVLSSQEASQFCRDGISSLFVNPRKNCFYCFSPMSGVCLALELSQDFRRHGNTVNGS